MPELHVHEPALCCTTDARGPERDQARVSVTADAPHVEAGGQVARYSLASDPPAFVDAEGVRACPHVAVVSGTPISGGSTGGCC